MPLHPMIVHFPLALSLLFPLTALFFFLEIQLERQTQRVWNYVFALGIVFFLSALGALKAGENEEETVEKFVPEEAIHNHEEKAEWLLILAGGAALIAGVPLLSRSPNIRRVGYVATVVVGFGTTAAAFLTGHSGASLVYEKGAADSYMLRKTGQSIFENPVEEMNDE